jgi:iron complex outermembrane recepter protein
MRKNKRPATAFARKSLVVATEIAITLMAAPLALAQTAERVEKIEITGSRIPSPNLESASPVAVISAEDIKFEGVRNVENLLNNLPQVFAELGGSVSNGATGTATVNLRNLGSVRTLVLMNGRRLPPGSPITGAYAADLNQVPAPLIQRIEVLTGGASAVYGSDAVAGVVNFIMRDNFEGVQLDANYSFFNHHQHNSVASIVAGREATNPVNFHVPGDANQVGESTDVSMLMGGNFSNNKGNATVFFGYKKDQPLLQAKYDYSACSFNPSATGFVCGGSTTGNPGRVIAPTGQFVAANAAGGVRPYNGATDQFNFAPYNYYQRPSERYSFHATAHYDVASNARIYGEFGFHDDHTVAQIAPSGLFGVPITLHGDNPFLTAAWRTALGLATNTNASSVDVVLQRRNVEGGGRQADLRHTSFRTVAGIKGEIAKYWDYDIYMQTSQVIYQQIYRNEFSIARGGAALDAVLNAAGVPVCRSTLNGTDATGLCQPYNMFALGGVSQGSLDFLQTPGLQKGSTSQKIQGATLTGDLGNYGLKVPGAKSGVGIAVGVERRVEELILEVDTEFSTGDLAGQGGPTIGRSGKVEVKDYFVEARIPIIERGETTASLSGSYRYSDYSTGVNTDTYGVGAEITPFRMVKFRGSYQQAVRAANINELFSAQALGLFAMNSDPCAGATPTRSRADCARTGVSAAQYGTILDNPAGQYNALFGGNPRLKPETAKTASAGIVFTPLRNLNASVDYWQIKIDDVISTLPSPIVIQQCLDTGAFCDLITRDRLGTLWLLPQAQVIATNVNLAKFKVSGVDFAANYNQPLGRWGGLGINFLGTWSKEFITEPIPGLGDYDCNGLHGGTCGIPQPKWRHKLRVNWGSPWSVDAAVTWRHIDKVAVDVSSSNPLLTGSFSPVDKELGQRDYIDIAASWAITKQLTIRGGINNVFDKDPPLVSVPAQAAVFGNGNTYPQVYDALGRKVFIGATYNF